MPKMRFDLEPKSRMGPDGFERPRWYHRLAARIVAKRILNGKAQSHQCSGRVNWLLDFESGKAPLFGGDADIQVPSAQLAHWVLRNVGYKVCPADLMVDPDA